jgi:hypothetical protein
MIVHERLKQLERIHHENFKNSQRREFVLPHWSPADELFGLVIAAAELDTQLWQSGQDTLTSSVESLGEFGLRPSGREGVPSPWSERNPGLRHV